MTEEREYMTNPLPPAANKKPKGCTYPKCDCADVFCKEMDPMTNQESSVELKACPFCGESDERKIHVHRPTCKKDDKYNPMDRLYPIVRCISCFASVHGRDEDESCRSAVEAWNTRAQAPDGVKDELIRKLWVAVEQLDDVSMKSSCAVQEAICRLSPTPQEAERGELIDRLGRWISALSKDDPYPGKEMADAIVLITESYLALQSTPPQQGEWELVERIVALMDAVKKKRIDPVLGDVEDDIYNTLKDCLTALQQRSGVCTWKWQESECFVTTSCGEELCIEEGSDYMPKFCQCCGKTAIGASHE